MDESFPLQKIRGSNKILVSFPDLEDPSSSPVYILRIGHWLLLSGCLLIRGDKAYVNTELR